MKGVTNRYTVAVGLVFLALVVVMVIHTLSGGGEDILGLDEQPPRWPLPEFAVPAALGGPEADANVYQDDCGSASLPCPDGSTRAPACRIDTAGAIRVCDLFGRPLVISFWWSGDSGRCERQQNLVSALAARYGGRVNFLSLDVRDSRGSLREAVHAHAWKMPVGFDRDGALAELYRVVACPTFAFAYPGGTLWSAHLGVLGPAALNRRVRDLLRATRAAERS